MPTSSPKVRLLRCPVCGYELRTTRTGHVHCGPHDTNRPPPDHPRPAAQMRKETNADAE